MTNGDRFRPLLRLVGRRRQRRVVECSGATSPSSPSSSQLRLRSSSSSRRRRCSGGTLLLSLLPCVAFFAAVLVEKTATTVVLLPTAGAARADAADAPTGDDTNKNDGLAAFRLGKRLLQEEKKYAEASQELWKSVLLHSSSSSQSSQQKEYDVQEAFTLFMQCYVLQDKLVDGLAFVSIESFRRGQREMGINYLNQALSIDPEHEGALLIQKEYGLDDEFGDGAAAEQEDEEREGDPFDGKSPEDLYELASAAFSQKLYEECADLFELSCERSGGRLGPSCANAVYCRACVSDWGFNGTQFEADMDRVAELTAREAKLHRYAAQGASTADSDDGTASFVWQRATSVHPHMMLGYPLKDSLLKRYAAESASYMDEKMARVVIKNADGGGGSVGDGTGGVYVPPLPPDMPFDVRAYRDEFVRERDDAVATQKNEGGDDGDAAAVSKPYRIRIGFVGSGFSSKAVLYLSQDMFRFFDPNRFEVHVFSFGPPDHDQFIEIGMRGADWRERVKRNVDRFHDCQKYVKDHVGAARYIHDERIHVLIEWDGFARQGERAQGLFALRPAPIQILHQEYLGTSGALYVDYIFSDMIASPPKNQHLYTEKIIYMPNHFFSKGHTYQAEVKDPSYEYRPKSTPYKLGTGSPQENRCLASTSAVQQDPSFVFCNFNKFLKNNPQTLRSWIRILRNVPNSMLCLLENPTEGVPYLRRFVHETAGISAMDGDFASFRAGDGDQLNERIRFLKWERNPFDHQARNQVSWHSVLHAYHAKP